MESTPLTKEQEAIKEVQALIESRRTKIDYGFYSFKLLRKNTKLNGALYIKPMCTFRASNGYKLKLRYSEDFNSIFEMYQDDEPIQLSGIWMSGLKQIKDPVLIEYLLVYPQFGKSYGLIDQAGEDEKKLDDFNKFHDVWAKVMGMTDSQLMSVLLFDSGLSLSQISLMGRPSMLMQLMAKTQADPSNMAEIIVNPIMELIYLYHTAMDVRIIRMNKNGAIVWSDTSRELMQVPPNAEPAKHFAKMMQLEKYESARSALESKING